MTQVKHLAVGLALSKGSVKIDCCCHPSGSGPMVACLATVTISEY